MRNKKKQKIIFFILTVILLGIIIFAIHLTLKTQTPHSDIAEKISDYNETGAWDADSSSFSEDSAEALFITGMKYYTQKDIPQAEACFKKAETSSYTDVALPVYLNIYLNQCSIDKTGAGNIDYVRDALTALAKYPSLANQSYWAWNLSYSLVEDGTPGNDAVEVFEEYIKNVQGLSKDEMLLLNTYQAILKNITGDYSESILLFHNLFKQAADMPESYNVIKTKSICTNYIGDMYYSYEDYQRASELYLELMNLKIDDPYENAQLKYTAYINMGNIYLKQKNYKMAKEIVAETKELLPYLSETFATEINAFLYNILANIELEQGRLTTASSYFDECLKFMESSQNSAFFDTQVYFGLTKCKMLQQSGDLEQAENILLGLLEHNIVEPSMKYEVHDRLSDIYRITGQEQKYHEQMGLLLKERNKQIEQYKSDYCEIISYYDALLDLQKEHTASVQRNNRLVIALMIAMVAIALIVKLSVLKYEESITDALTGLYNRKKLEQELGNYQKDNQKFLSSGLIMLDIDFFKKYNDTYGHAAGDIILKKVASIIKESVRDKDTVIRYGGEEFLIILKNINHSTVESIAERIRVNVETEQIPHEASECNSCITLSVGCFYIENPAVISLSEAIKKADCALYYSKQHGRNMVTK